MSCSIYRWIVLLTVLRFYIVLFISHKQVARILPELISKDLGMNLEEQRCHNNVLRASLYLNFE